MAYCLAVRTGGTTGSSGRRWAWRAVTAALVSAGVVSCAISSQADTWWNKYGSYHQAEAARFINRAASPLVLVGGPIPLLGLSHLVHAGVTLQLAQHSFEPPPARFSDIFVYQPSPRFFGALAGQTGHRVMPVYEPGKLWRLEGSQVRASTSRDGGQYPTLLLKGDDGVVLVDFVTFYWLSLWAVRLTRERKIKTKLTSCTAPRRGFES